MLPKHTLSESSSYQHFLIELFFCTISSDSSDLQSESSWPNNSPADTRFLASFSKHLLNMFSTLLLIFTHLKSTYSFLRLAKKSFSYSAFNGTSPATNSYIIAPTLHTSTFSLYPTPKLSGALYNSVPVFVQRSNSYYRYFLTPHTSKSITFIPPVWLLYNMFSGLRSRWHIPSLCKYFSTEASCLLIDSIYCESNFFPETILLQIYDLRSASSQNSITTNIVLFPSSKWKSVYSIICGWSSNLTILKWFFIFFQF